MNGKIDAAARQLVESYTANGGVKIHHLDRHPLPSHAEITRVLAVIQELLFPGYVGVQAVNLTDAPYRILVDNFVDDTGLTYHNWVSADRRYNVFVRASF